MSPNHLKRYSKTKVRHQRKELDERKKRITGLTLQQNMGQNAGEPERKRTTRASTGFTRAAREFGERRCLFETEAYASVVSHVKQRPKITKGRLTVPTQGLFARGKISKPACRAPLPVKRTRAQDCELHEIIRQAQNNPRGQQYQLQKQLRKDWSPDVDDPEPVPSPDLFDRSFEGQIQEDRFSPDYTSTKRHDSQLARARAATSTIVRDDSPPQAAVATAMAMSPNAKSMLSLSGDLLSPESQASIREMELEENVMDGMTKWVVQLRAGLNISKLGYLDETRQYLKDLHKETLRRELETAANTQKAVTSKHTMRTPKDVLQINLDQTNRKQFHDEATTSKNSELEKLYQTPELSNQHTGLQRHLNEFKDLNRILKPLTLLQTTQTDLIASRAKDSYTPLEGNPFARCSNDTVTIHQTRTNYLETNDLEVDSSTDGSFIFSPKVSTPKIITDLPAAFGPAKVSEGEKNKQEGNSCRLREGRERVHRLQAEAAEERERLRLNKEREYREQFQVYREKLRSHDKFRSRSYNRMDDRVVDSPRRSSKSVERSDETNLDWRQRNGNPGQLVGKNREGMRNFGVENRNWCSKGKERSGGGQQQWDGERRDAHSANYRRAGNEPGESRYHHNDLRSPRGLPDWLLEKTPERIFRPRKMFD